MSIEYGLKRMTISKLAERCGIAKGTFYHFFDSKEEFVFTLFAEEEGRNFQEFLTLLHGRSKMPLEEMMRWYRSLFIFDTNLFMSFKTEDFMWLKKHFSAYGMFNPKNDKIQAEKLFSKVDGVRPDCDLGVVVNFIKSIYSMTENLDSFCRESIDTNIDLIFETIYQYVKAEDA